MLKWDKIYCVTIEVFDNRVPTLTKKKIDIVFAWY